MEPVFLSGQLLLAMPGIGDPRFERAVIAMCVHDERGALGIGIGRLATRIGLHTLLEQFEIPVGAAPDTPVLLGGPVDPQRGFVLHSLDWGGQDTMEVDGRFALTNTIDILRAIAEGKGPRRWLPALGYAGWGEGQLEHEILHNAWLNTHVSQQIPFETPARDRWQAATRLLGVDVTQLAGNAGHA